MMHSNRHTIIERTEDKKSLYMNMTQRDENNSDIENHMPYATAYEETIQEASRPDSSAT